MSILDKIVDENSVLRSSQQTREFIMKSENPRSAANSIIVELGGKPLPKLYDARITAMNMVGDHVRLGAEFDAEASYQNGVLRSEIMRKNYPSFAQEEDKMDTVIDTVKPAKAPKLVKPKAEKPAKEAKPKAEKPVKVKAEKGERKRPVLKSGKERGAMRDVARKIYLENRDAPNKMIVQLIAEALGIPKTNAYTHVYLVKQELKKKGEL